MKFIVLFVAICLSLATFAAEENSKPYVSPGKVICSLTEPRTVGFEVVTARAMNKDSKGSIEIDNLKVSGKYWAAKNLLSLSVSRIDQFGDEIQEILFSEMKLLPGETYHSKTQHGDMTLDIYCYFIPPTL